MPVYRVLGTRIVEENISDPHGLHEGDLVAVAPGSYGYVGGRVMHTQGSVWIDLGDHRVPVVFDEGRWMCPATRSP